MRKKELRLLLFLLNHSFLWSGLRHTFYVFLSMAFGRSLYSFELLWSVPLPMRIRCYTLQSSLCKGLGQLHSNMWLFFLVFQCLAAAQQVLCSKTNLFQIGPPAGAFTAFYCCGYKIVRKPHNKTNPYLQNGENVKRYSYQFF